MSRFFVLASSPRAGTSFLGELLHSNGFSYPGEYFNASSFDKPFSRAIVLGQSTELFAKQRIPSGVGKLGIGVKLFWSMVTPMLTNSKDKHQNPFSLFESLFPGAKYIFLTRNDCVAQAISLLRANDTGQWVKTDDSSPKLGATWAKKLKSDRIYKTILGLKANDYAWRQFFAANNITPLELTYEELVADLEPSLTNVGLYLAGSEFKLRTLDTKLKIQRDAESKAVQERFLRDNGV